MSDEDNKIVRDSGAAATYVESVNGYPGPYVTLTANDVKAYTTAQSDAKFTVPIASATTLSKIRVGAGLTIDANGVLGTQASAPDWSNITNKPTEFPPNKAGQTVLGGVKVGTGLSIATDGTLSATGTAPDWSQITNKPAAYPPTIAGPNKIGGVKQGSGIFIDPETGTINSASSIPTWDAIVDKPTTFPPPVATDKVLGGVKEGVNVEIDANGSISAIVQWDTILGKPTEYPPPIASKTVRGGVYVGEGLQDDNNGVISLRLAASSDIGGIILGSTLTTNPQDGRTDVVPASQDNFGAVKIGDTLYIDDKGDLQANPGAISPATETTLGGIKVGAGLSITEDGILSSVSFTNRLAVGGAYADVQGEWTVPDNIEYFRVTVVGAGGKGGNGSSDASKGPAGGGGGSGGVVQALFSAKKYPKGQVFAYQAGGAQGVDPDNRLRSASFFRKKGADPLSAIIAGTCGVAGQTWNEAGPTANGWCKGGDGGKAETGGVDVGVVTVTFACAGQKGGIGASYTIWNGKQKAFAGRGGSCAYGLGSNHANPPLGYGGGGQGGDADDAASTTGCDPQRGLVVIEW